MVTPPKTRGQEQKQTLADMVFFGLKGKVLAIDRYTGKIIWEFNAPKGSGFVSLLLDGDRLVAAVNGYIYCLDPIFGQEVWSNPLKGYGLGIMSLTSVNGSSATGPSAAVIEQRRRAAAAAGAGAAG